MKEDKKYWDVKQIKEYIDNINEARNIEADLHNHTTGSDGTQSPLRMLLRANNRGKNIVSISDHDSVKGYTQLKRQILKIIQKLEEINEREDISEEEKRKAKLGTERLLNILENVKILPAAELITSYKGYSIEILAYGADIDILEDEIKDMHEGLIPGSRLLLEGTDRIINERNLTFDRFVIENRSNFKKLFFHELRKHPENKRFYDDEEIYAETESEMAEKFSKKYLESEESPFYVNMEQTEERGVKQIRRDFLEMIKRNSNEIKFDKNVIENSHAVTGEFFYEVIKHPENMYLLSEEVDNLKKFIYGELYNPRSPFFIDMSPSRPSFERTVQVIHKAGGKAFLAHPGRYQKQFDVKEEINHGSILDGIDGIEVFYPTHDTEMKNYLLEKCRERGLMASGGSDDHLTPKDGEEYKMGTINIPDIPETQWIKENIVDGKEYIQQAKELNMMLKKLQKLKEEKFAKEKILDKRIEEKRYVAESENAYEKD